MENMECKFNGMVMNGFLMLFVNFAVLILSIVGIVFSIIDLDSSDGTCGGWLLGGSLLLLVANIIITQAHFHKLVTTGLILSMVPRRCRCVPVTWMPNLSR